MLRLPGGSIFHGDLSWPWLEDDAPTGTPAQRWGVGTGLAGIHGMIVAFRVAGGVFLLGLLALLSIMILGWTAAYEWASLSGPGPAWPATVGFASLYAIGLGGAALVVLAAIVIAREGVRSVRAATRRAAPRPRASRPRRR